MAVWGSQQQEAGPRLLLSFPVFLDGHERSIALYEGQSARQTVTTFFEQHHVASTHIEAVTREVRRKLAESPSLADKVQDEDRIQVANTVVDIGEGRLENATFVLDGREEVQVLQWCNDRGLGPVCVSGILKGLAQQMRHIEMSKQVSSPTNGDHGQESQPSAMLVVPVMLNGHYVNMIGHEGQTVAEVRP